MRHTGLATAALALLGAAGLSAATARVAAQKGTGVSLSDVVDTAAAYVQDYEQQLTSVVADEISTQRILSQAPKDPVMPVSRRMTNDIFFMFAPASRGWMAIRDVTDVDGQPVRDRVDLKAALRTLPSADVALTFKRYNSRYNLGRIVRTFNEPTLSLLVLDANNRSRFAFEQVRTQRKKGIVLVTLDFAEKSAPTLIQDLAGRPAFSRGELVVEAVTGRVRQATFTVRIGTVLMNLVTTYGPEERLGIWVPATFDEHYVEHAANGRREDIACHAVYSNFHRFEVTTRIK